jgi:hypothetical protein
MLRHEKEFEKGFQKDFQQNEIRWNNKMVVCQVQ